MQVEFKKNLEKKQTSKGLGIFAKSEILKDKIIFEFTGNFFDSSKLPNPLTNESDMFVQIGKDLFLGPSGDLDDYVNHSCSPNCALIIIGKRVFLKTLAVITPSVEITFDYSITSTDNKNDWSMKCKCASFNCRKIISGFQYLDKKIKEQYKSLGIVPKYVLDEEK